ncbi:MAG: T9SS type A sorting domain-containing protein [Candidatus Marinimicrobia bacterium]|nr:T9SS type A sorting domain-containing protein [Candidatus Neomarinimicrobiota bacterium]
MRRSIKGVWLSVLLLSTSAIGTIIHVPQDQPTIQDGIDAAVDGDTVLVDTGRYTENINFNGKNIVLGSLYLSTSDTSYVSQTVIDGDRTGNVATIENGEDSTTVLSGFTLTNGSGWGIYCYQSNPSLSNLSISDNWGGGLYSKVSNLRLTSSVISRNSSQLLGGGIFCDSSTIQLEGVDIRGNLATTNGGGIYGKHSSFTLQDTRVFHNDAWEGTGGGIFLEDSHMEFQWGNDAFFHGGGIATDGSSLVFNDVSVTENEAEYNGGGLHYTNSVVVFRNGMVTDNVAVFGDGGGFYCVDTRITVERSAIVFNDAADAGGGIMVLTTLEFTESLGWPPSLLVNVTMTGNIASRGGGLFCSNSVHPVMVNTILWDNTPQEIGFDDSAWWPSSVTITHSDLLGGRDSILTTERDSVYWLGGNMDVDPLFVDAENRDFNLLDGSPAIDAGISLFIWEGDTIVNLPDTTYEGNAPDMGAFESPYTAGIEEDQIIPEKFALRHPYPNPFNPTTNIEFSLPKSGLVYLNVHDILGRKVETILNQHMDAGTHKLQWDASNVPTGIYFMKMVSGDFNQTRKMVLLK